MNKIVLLLGLLVLSGCKEDNISIAAKTIEYLQLRNQMASYSGSVLIARNDSIILSKGFGKADRKSNINNRADTKFKIGSITKTFTAIAILQLQEKGVLSIEDKLVEHLPNMIQIEQVKIKHLLNHSSGLPQDWRSEWHEKKIFPFNSIIDSIGQMPLLFEPGTQEQYSNCGYALLSAIIEEVSGLSYEEYCAQYIFQAAGMKNTGAVFYPNQSYSNFAIGYEFGKNVEGYNATIEAEYLYTPNLKGQASAYSTVEDLYKYDRAIRKNRLLDTTSTNLLFSTLPNSEYTLGSWIKVPTKLNGELAYFSGVSNGYESVLYHYLEEDITIIALNNHQNSDVFRVSRTMAAILNNQEVYMPKVRTAQSYTIKDYEVLAGKYEHPDDPEDTFEVFIEEDRLFLYSHGDPLEELFLENPLNFFTKNYDLQLDFSEKKLCTWTYNGISNIYLKKD